MVSGVSAAGRAVGSGFLSDIEPFRAVENDRSLIVVIVCAHSREGLKVRIRCRTKQQEPSCRYLAVVDIADPDILPVIAILREPPIAYIIEGSSYIDAPELYAVIPPVIRILPILITIVLPALVVLIVAVEEQAGDGLVAARFYLAEGLDPVCHIQIAGSAAALVKVVIIADPDPLPVGGKAPGLKVGSGAVLVLCPAEHDIRNVPFAVEIEIAGMAVIIGLELIAAAARIEQIPDGVQRVRFLGRAYEHPVFGGGHFGAPLARRGGGALEIGDLRGRGADEVRLEIQTVRFIVGVLGVIGLYFDAYGVFGRLILILGLFAASGAGHLYNGGNYDVVYSDRGGIR